MWRSLAPAAAWLALGAGRAEALAPAVGDESTWPHLPSLRVRPAAAPGAPAAVRLDALAEAGRGAPAEGAERAGVEHEGHLCAGLEGVDRKQLAGVTLAGDAATSSARACAAAAEQDGLCGPELYFGTAQDGRRHCGCVLRGRSCLKERAPEGANFDVFLVNTVLHSGPAPYAYGAEGPAEAEPGASPQPVHREKVTSAHSHAVLRELMAAPAKEELARMETFESMFDPSAPATARAPAPPPQVLDLPPQSQPPLDELVGAPGAGFCAGSPAMYDGPTTGWEDCRTKCANHRCGFWSYWHDSLQHRCKLTTGCRRRERDSRHSVSAYRGTQAADEGDDDDMLAGDDVPAEAQVEAAPVAEAVQSALGSRAGCLSPQGTARTFAASPQSGWHNLGRVDSYVSCSNAAGSLGYKNIVFNIGAVAKGRCYGFAGGVPDVQRHGCEDTYCWLFGPACEDAARAAGGVGE